MPHAVIDFETTGLVPERGDRVVEVGLVLVDGSGAIEHEWTTLVNPGRDIGPTHIHGLRAADLLDAPEFGDIADELLGFLSGRMVVAHNAPFDMRFMQAELQRADYPIGQRPAALCSMKWAGRLIGSAKLEHCCEALDIELVGAHAALVDARATADLMSHLRVLGSGWPEWAADVERSRGFVWPRPVARRRRVTPVLRSTVDEQSTSWLETVLGAAWISAEPEDEASYLLALDRALLDRSISLTEGRELAQVAESSGLTSETVQRLHHDYLLSVAKEAIADGEVTDDEHADLDSVASALGLGRADVDKALVQAASSAEGQPGGFALQPGDRVVFTGDMVRPRDEWVAEIVAAGLVSGGVTKTTKLLVAADPDSMSGKASKARKYGVPIVDEAGFERIFAAFERDGSSPLGDQLVEPLVAAP